MKSLSRSAKVALSAVGTAIIAGTFWMLHHALSGQDGKSVDAHTAAAQTPVTSPPGAAARQASEEITRRAEQKVLDYSDVRRRLQNGELTTLPPDLAPPPLPVEPAPVQ